MHYCKQCVMPSTRPGITFNKDGICSACQHYASRSTTDWGQRWKEFEAICDKYRGMNGSDYDCMIAVSGGKDSHFQTHLMKNVMGMNPLLVTVEDNFKMTQAGSHNIKNISEAFGCNIISLKPNLKLQKIVMRYTFEKYAKPCYILERYIYIYPLYMAHKFNTPLVIYGENVSWEYGGIDDFETYSAREQINNGIISEIETQDILEKNKDVSIKDLSFFSAPNVEEMKKLDPAYISYFTPWNSFKNYEIAKKYGFHDLTHEWHRTHHIENMDQVENAVFLLHAWMKYPKFGHAQATDYAARMIRYGMITREKAASLVRKHDHDLDPKCVRDFCEFLGYSEQEFWNIVDKFYNRDIFVKDEQIGTWVLKNGI